MGVGTISDMQTSEEATDTVSEPTKLIGIVSDPHANEWSLKRALEALKARGVTLENTYCTGDVVGYCGRPVEVIDLCMGLGGTTLGNHDLALKYVKMGMGHALPGIMNSMAADSIFRTLNKIREMTLVYKAMEGFNDKEISDADFIKFVADGKGNSIQKDDISTMIKETKRLEFIVNLPEEIQITPKIKLLHAPRMLEDDESPSENWDYVLPTDAARVHGFPEGRYTDPRELALDKKLFSDETKILVMGHSHFPFAQIFNENGDLVRGNIYTRNLTLRKGERAIIGAGSTSLSRRQDKRKLDLIYDGMRAAEVGIVPLLFGDYVVIDGDKIEMGGFLYSYKREEEEAGDFGMKSKFTELTRPRKNKK